MSRADGAGRDRSVMTQPGHPSVPPLWRTLLAVVAAPALLFGWDTAATLIIISRAQRLLNDELLLYLIVKGSFAALLCIGLTVFRRWRRLGFKGGSGWRRWPFLLPAWLAGAMSLSQGFPDASAGRAICWLGLGAMIAFGEETVFRGLMIDALLARGPRLAIFASGLLFGLTHLAGIAAGIDARMVAAQAIFATGLGFCFGWVRIATGSIWPTIIAHALMDGIGLAAADGVGNAMHYNSDDFVELVAMAAVSLIWGIAIAVRPLPAAARG